MSEPLIQRLKRSCREVLGERSGTGFFIAPSVIVTCAHVIGKREVGSAVAIRKWPSAQSDSVQAKLVACDHERDIALLDVTETCEDFVPLGGGARVGDQLIAQGFPQRSGRREFDQVELTYEGQTEFRDALGREGIEEKIKSGQLEPGFSGGPLLNLRTARVMGMLSATRDRNSALGGWAIGAEQVIAAMDAAGIEFPPMSEAWRHAIAEQRRLGQGARPAPFQAEAVPQHFVPRDDIMLPIVAGLFGSGDESVTIAALHGAGGMGKSTLAAALSQTRDVSDHCPDGILWVKLGQTPKLLELISMWVEAVEGGKASLSVEGCASILRSALHRRAMLLVIDDVWEADHAKPFLVGGPLCRTIITTRRAHIPDLLGADTFLVDALSPDQSLQLILKRSRSRALSEQELADVASLAQAVSHLPLAVEILGALLSRHRIEVLRAKLTPARPAHGGPPGQKSQAMEAVEACLALSISYLKARDRYGWTLFLGLGLTAPGIVFTPESVATIWGISRADADQILWRLADDALLIRSEAGFRLHDLMHEVVMRLAGTPAPHGLGLDRKDGHREIVRRYRAVAAGNWAFLPVDGYAHSQLIAHAIATGDPAVLNDIIRSKCEDAKFSWFVAREREGNVAGYVQDIEAALAFFCRQEPPGLADQLFCSLVKSSIRSVFESTSPALLQAMVQAQIWSPLTAYQWIAEFRADERRIDYFIALLEGLKAGHDTRTDEDSTAGRVRERVLTECFGYLHAQALSKRTAILLGRIFNLVPDEMRPELLRRINASPDDLEQRIAFLGQLPDQARRDLVVTTCAQIERTPSLTARIRLLVSAFNLIAAADRGLWGARLVTWLGELQALDRPPETDDHAVADGPQGGEAPVQALREAQANGPANAKLPAIAEAEEAENPLRPELDLSKWQSLFEDDEFVTELRAVLIYLDASALEAIASLIEQEQLDWNARRVLSTIAFIRSHEEAPDRPQDSTLTEIQRASRRGDFGKAFQCVAEASDQRLALFTGVLDDCDNYLNAERICLAALPGWTGLDQAERKVAAAAIQAKFPSSPSALAYVAAASGKHADFLDAIADKLNDLSKPDLERAAILCVSLGLGGIVQSALSKVVRIGDRADQAAAVFSLMPYLPRKLPVHVLATWQDEGAVGTEIAALTQMMMELVEAISADALIDVVNAAIKQHSEWWVVEALTDTLLRLRERGEFQAILAASHRLRNSDLRIRIIGRTARRACDFGHVDFAMSALSALPDGPLKWDEQLELALRLASASDAANAFLAADAIVSSETRARAYALIALELAAQGQATSYDAIRRSGKLKGAWREWVEQCVGAYEPREAGDVELISSRVTSRRRSEASQSQMLRTVESLRARHGDLETLAALEAAVKGKDDEALIDATAAFWRTGTNEEPLSLTLARCPRPEQMRRLAQVAPLVGALGEDETSGLLIAIQEVGSAWP